jgi:hypothetical protein
MGNSSLGKSSSSQQENPDSGRNQRYFFYAIGEILLVMIGILLALQANNWNEGRIQRKEISSSIKALSAEMEANQAILGGCLTDLLRRRNALDQIRLNTIESLHHVSVDSLNKLISVALGNMTRCEPNTDVLKEIQNSGRISQLSQEILRRSISRWSSIHNEYMREENSWDDAFVNNILPATFDKIAWNDVDILFAENFDNERLPASIFQLDPRDNIYDSLEFENVLNMQNWFIWKIRIKLAELKSQTEDVQRLISEFYGA